MRASMEEEAECSLEKDTLVLFNMKEGTITSAI